MNDKKNNYLKVQVDQKMEEAFRKIIEKKGLSIQTALEIIINLSRLATALLSIFIFSWFYS